VAVPNVRASLAAGWRAAAASIWLAPVGMLVAVLCSGLALPARLFGAAVAARGALGGLAHDGPTPAAAAAGALEALLRPRIAALLLGLWAAGLLLSAALRVAYLAGALPTLGHALAGTRPPPPAFATGLAYGTPRLAGTGFLVFLLDLAGTGFAATVLLGAILVSSHAHRLGPIPAALAVAAAVTLWLLLSFALSTLGDAALARSALRDEPPFQALASAAARFLARPAAFLLTALFAALAGWVLAGSARTAANVLLGVAHGAPGWLLLGPQLLTLAMVALLGSLLELWRIASVAVLACHQEPGEPSPAATPTAPATPGSGPR